MSGMYPSPVGTDAAGRRWLHLILAIVVLIGAWLVVLPMLGSYPPVRRYLDWTAEQNLNANAMFYTEVPEFEEHVARATRRAHETYPAVRHEFPKPGKGAP